MVDELSIFDPNYFASLYEKISKKLDKNNEIKHYEMYCSSGKQTSISYEEGFIKKAFNKDSSGLGLRIIGLNGKEGMTFTSDYSDSAIDRIIKDGRIMMRVSTENPEFKNLAIPSKKYNSVEGIYDPEIDNLNLEDIQEIINPIFDLKKKEIALHSLSGNFSSSINSVYIFNSNGINQNEKKSYVNINSEISLLGDSEFPSAGFSWQSESHLKNLSVENVAERSYQMAYRGLNKVSVETGKYPILLSPLAVAFFLIDPISKAINSEAVQHQMSFLADHLNEEIGDKSFTLVDDPYISGKLNTTSFDCEGAATKPIKIIDKGILNEFYYNSFTAGKEGIETNGHASRSHYASNVGISNHNLIMSEGKEHWEDILGGIKRGIYFDYTGDSPNYVTGDFSGLILTGCLIEDGEITKSLSEALIGINLLDAFKQIETISKERLWIDEAYVPWVKLSNATISGRK
ncbi:MAG: TldD/PmbA family protein [Promethearchaeota archaeon]